MPGVCNPNGCNPLNCMPVIGCMPTG
jgi:hypothetical protein